MSSYYHMAYYFYKNSGSKLDTFSLSAEEIGNIFKEKSYLFQDGVFDEKTGLLFRHQDFTCREVLIGYIHDVSQIIKHREYFTRTFSSNYPELDEDTNRIVVKIPPGQGAKLIIIKFWSVVKLAFLRELAAVFFSGQILPDSSGFYLVIGGGPSQYFLNKISIFLEFSKLSEKEVTSGILTNMDPDWRYLMKLPGLFLEGLYLKLYNQFDNPGFKALSSGPRSSLYSGLNCIPDRLKPNMREIIRSIPKEIIEKNADSMPFLGTTQLHKL